MDLDKKHICWLFFVLKGFSYNKVKKMLLFLKLNYKYNYKEIFFFFNKKKKYLYELQTIKVKIIQNLSKYKKKYRIRLKKYIKLKKKKWKKIKHYKWYRYKKHLPLNGQRTKTNSRTRRKLKFI